MFNSVKCSPLLSLSSFSVTLHLPLFTWLFTNCNIISLSISTANSRSSCFWLSKFWISYELAVLKSSVPMLFNLLFSHNQKFRFCQQIKLCLFFWLHHCSVLYHRDIRGHDNTNPLQHFSNLTSGALQMLQRSISRVNMSVSLVFLFLLPPTSSLLQPRHSFMSGTHLKTCPSFFFLSMLVEGEGATISCWAREPAVGGHYSNWRDSMWHGGWCTGPALTFWYFSIHRDLNNVSQAYGCMTNKGAWSRH